MHRRAAPTIAATFALAAFAVATTAGTLVGNDPHSVILKALVALGLCYPAGLLAGSLAQRVVDGQIALHQAANPLPDGIDAPSARALAGEVTDEGDEAAPSEGATDAEADVIEV